MTTLVPVDTAPPASDEVAPLPYAIDPEGCVCERCESGIHIPLEKATREARVAMQIGAVVDRTGLSFLELYAWEQANDPEEETDEYDR